MFCKETFYVVFVMWNTNLIPMKRNTLGVKEQGIVYMIKCFAITSSRCSLPNNLVLNFLKPEYFIKYTSKMMTLMPVTVQIDASFISE